jgi:hypothetical protein
LIGVFVGVAVGIGVKVGVSVGVFVGVSVAVAVGVSVGVFVGVSVAVAVGVFVGILLTPGPTQDGSSVPVQVSVTVTADGAPDAPLRVMRNCGSPTLVERFSPDRLTVPVASIALSGIPGMGFPSPSSKETVPLLYVPGAGCVIFKDMYVVGWHNWVGTTKLDASTRIGPCPHAPPV